MSVHGPAVDDRIDSDRPLQLGRLIDQCAQVRALTKDVLDLAKQRPRRRCLAQDEVGADRLEAHLQRQDRKAARQARSHPVDARDSESRLGAEPLATAILAAAAWRSPLAT